MQAQIERGRIHVHLGDNLDEVGAFQLFQQMTAAIGSARPVKDSPQIGSVPLFVSCALSVVNFRKLKALGCRLADDAFTKKRVVDLRAELDAYQADSARAALAKVGKLELPAYEFKKKPFAHQIPGWQFLHSLKQAALFGDCGTGKTFIVSTVVDSKIKWGQKYAAIVICPVNLIKHVWMDDVEKFTDLSSVSLREEKQSRCLAEDFDEPTDPPDLSRLARAALRDTRREDPAYKKIARHRANVRHAKLIKERFQRTSDVYILNFENLRTDPKEKRVRDLCKRLRAEGKTVYLVIDECSKIKSRTSRTFKALSRIRDLCDECVIMTGTPSPNGLEDLWAPFALLDGGQTLQPNFVDYRHDTCQEIVLRGVTWEDKKGKTHNATKWWPKPGAAMQVYRMIEPRMIRFRTEDCIDLPAKRFLIRDVEMSVEQREIYDLMEERQFAELEGEPVTAAVAATKMIKLREITGGFVITDNKEAKLIGKDSPKMLELDDLLKQSIADKLGDTGRPSKGLVWAQYQWECKTLVARYAKRYGAMGLFGGISSGAKDRAITRFKSDPSCRLLICHPASVGHGLTLTDADYAFYYSLSHNFEEFYQSYRRNARAGQTRVMTYYFLICPGTIDEELLDALRDKKNLSDLVTDGRFSREEILGRRGARSGTQFEISWDTPDVHASPAG